MRRVAGLVLLAWVLVSCGARPVRMLHERPSFMGKITLKSDTLSVAGELVFDRQSRNCQLIRRQPTMVVLGRNRDGQLFAYENAKPRRFRAKEERLLLMVLALVDGNGVTAPRVLDAGYSVELVSHGRVRVTIEEARTRPHGERR